MRNVSALESKLVASKLWLVAVGSAELIKELRQYVLAIRVLLEAAVGRDIAKLIHPLRLLWLDITRVHLLQSCRQLPRQVLPVHIV